MSSGEFVTGGHAIAKEFNEGVSSDNQVVGRTLWRWLKKFEKEEMLSIKSTTKYSVITIKNWDEYQANDNQVSSGRQATVKPVSTIKNEKNDKNDKNIKDNSRKSAKRTYDEDSIYYQLAVFLFEEMKKNNPEVKHPDFDKWADEVRKMIELDGRKEEQVRNMITWSQSNDFWKGIVLSTKKLREKYDQMKVQALQPVKKNAWQQNAKKEGLPEWANATKSETKETPLSPEQQKVLNERISKLKSTGKEAGV
nr:replication protein [uncultured Trichococcus sp.]